MLTLKNLAISFESNEDTIHAVNNTSLTIEPGQFVGLVGESGSGKSVTSLSINRLIPDPPGKIESGEILYNSSLEILSVFLFSSSNSTIHQHYNLNKDHHHIDPSIHVRPNYGYTNLPNDILLNPYVPPLKDDRYLVTSSDILNPVA